MNLTLGNFIVAGVIIILAIITAIIYYKDSYELRSTILPLTIGIIVSILWLVGCHWYNTNTASGIRNYKDWQSEISNGIEREITITAEDGREIFHYEGKVDIESNHEDNYIKFESEDGKRYIIYYGITDTILIVEK